jgi:hypothetical protein
MEKQSMRVRQLESLSDYDQPQMGSQLNFKLKGQNKSVPYHDNPVWFVELRTAKSKHFYHKETQRGNVVHGSSFGFYSWN